MQNYKLEKEANNRTNWEKYTNEATVRAGLKCHRRRQERRRKKIFLVIISTFRPTFHEKNLYVVIRIMKFGTRISDFLVKVLKVDTFYVCQVTERNFASPYTLCWACLDPFYNPSLWYLALSTHNTLSQDSLRQQQQTKIFMSLNF